MASQFREFCKRAFLAGSCLMFSNSIAQAADADGIYDWSGLYARVHAGYAWGESEVTEQLASGGNIYNRLRLLGRWARSFWRRTTGI